MEPRQILWGLLVLFVVASGCNKANKTNKGEKGTTSEDVTLPTDSSGITGDTASSSSSNSGSDSDTNTSAVIDTASETGVGPNPDGTCAYDCVSACTSRGGVRRDGNCSGDLLCCDLPTSDADVDTDTDADSDSDSDSDSDADADSDSDTDADSDSDADTDTDTDTDADTDPEGCRTDYMSKSDEWCELSQQCPDGYRYANCDMWEGGDRRCWCEGNSGSFEFNLPDGVNKDACEFVVNICDDISIETIGEPECGSLREDFEEGWYCYISQDCTQTVQLTPDVTTELKTGNYASCDREYYYYEEDMMYIDADADADADGDANMENSDWWCNCSANGKNMSYRVSPMPDDAAPCGVVFDACKNGSEIVTDGDVVCDKRSMNQNPGRSCSIGYECEQSGTISGAQITMNGYMDASCNRNDAGEWECRCYGGNREETFSLTGTDAWTVCEEAGPKCMDMFTSEELVQNGQGYPGMGFGIE